MLIYKSLKFLFALKTELNIVILYLEFHSYKLYNILLFSRIILIALYFVTKLSAFENMYLIFVIAAMFCFNNAK